MNSNQLRENTWFKELPFIAILRGVETNEVLDIAKVLIENEFRFIEVPLNSPNPLESITKLVQEYGDEAIIGAGTVTNKEKLLSVLETGAKLIVSPNMCPKVIRIAREHDCATFSGVQTPTEAFEAVECGASALKFFPAELIQPAGVKAIKSVLPPEIVCCPTGGIEADPAQIKSYLDAGVDGFGLGSGLFKKGIRPSELNTRAKAYSDCFKSIQHN